MQEPGGQAVNFQFLDQNPRFKAQFSPPAVRIFLRSDPSTEEQQPLAKPQERGRSSLRGPRRGLKGQGRAPAAGAAPPSRPHSLRSGDRVT